MHKSADGGYQGILPAYGTIIFYEDMAQVKTFQDKFTAYESIFPIWSEQSSGKRYILIPHQLTNSTRHASIRPLDRS
jgi:predicted oxidoreductase (fatty acid repression mutant protein)